MIQVTTLWAWTQPVTLHLPHLVCLQIALPSESSLDDPEDLYACSMYTTWHSRGGRSACMLDAWCGSSGTCTTCTATAWTTARGQQRPLAGAPQTRYNVMCVSSTAWMQADWTLAATPCDIVLRQQHFARECCHLTYILLFNRRRVSWAAAAADTCRPPAPGQLRPASSEASSSGAASGRRVGEAVLARCTASIPAHLHKLCM